MQKTLRITYNRLRTKLNQEQARSSELEKIYNKAQSKYNEQLAKLSNLLANTKSCQALTSYYTASYTASAIPPPPAVSWRSDRLSHLLRITYNRLRTRLAQEQARSRELEKKYNEAQSKYNEQLAKLSDQLVNTKPCQAPTPYTASANPPPAPAESWLSVWLPCLRAYGCE